ncbi:carboxylating nicotinate-nucleotide diphosphorylase [Chitinibacter bivalviorum]|uniref:Probable nicotinate-nucleotide pyrophosphorylase [carboxylating] n=1 Tax=Chitinibacter bivalviorum TaxID=2739434 RepID=A0A7H9BL34_9NEIS|nr:carboxylating nicotinate-nucleotide diphosphorylase [Chitinibacter bivalviorum]QLG89219.1 carboxylating nicotinate-nucleotide diphosphorylase [Chitinibacter bivalviorum]
MINLPPQYIIAANVAAALAEDISERDWTAQLIPAEQTATAHIIVRQAAVICGLPWANEVIRQVDETIQIDWKITEGEYVAEDQLLCILQGNARSLLTAERSILNFIQTLSAVATETHRYAAVIKGTNAVVHDTRKTIPGLRRAQKYAVTVGGGANQRIALYDGILIKENHIVAAGSISNALAAAQSIAPKHVTIQIEVENLDELAQALAAGAESVLLDNMSLDEMRTAVEMSKGKAILEASGGVDLTTIRAIAETGVDRISVGKLTKDIQAVDLSMRFS